MDLPKFDLRGYSKPLRRISAVELAVIQVQPINVSFFRHLSFLLQTKPDILTPEENMAWEVSRNRMSNNSSLLMHTVFGISGRSNKFPTQKKWTEVFAAAFRWLDLCEEPDIGKKTGYGNIVELARESLRRMQLFYIDASEIYRRRSDFWERMEENRRIVHAQAEASSLMEQVKVDPEDEQKKAV